MNTAHAPGRKRPRLTFAARWSWVPAFAGMTRWSLASAFQLAGEQADVRIELGVLGSELLDLADGVDHGRMVAAAEASADLRQRPRGQLLREVHRHLAR